MIIEQIRGTMRRGTVIPQPEGKNDFTVKSWGRRRGQEALIYYVPNQHNPALPYQMGITVPDLEAAHTQLLSEGEFSRAWFNANLPACAKDGGCNFNAIGGVFQALGLVTYDGDTYRLV